MGILSKVKKGFSKAWKGVKKAVKKVARGVKKVAKKIAYATPWGKKAWDFSSKIGKKVQKGFAKFASAIGPVGMMALSFVLAPVMGPMLGALWSSFGAGAAGMAASANAFVSTLGSIGQGIFAAGNWVGGTLGAMGNAIGEGASNVMSGNFSAGAKAFASNMSSALTGEAGMASVNAAAAQAAQASGTLLGQGVDATAAVQSGVDASFAAENLGTQTAAEVPMGLGSQPVTSPQAIAEQAASQFQAQSTEQIAQEALYGKAGDLSLAESGALIDYGPEGVKAIQSGAAASSSGTSDALKKAADVAGNLLGGGQAEGTGVQPFVPSTQYGKITAASNAAGSGSEGFSLLSGVQGLEQSVRRSQQMMFG